MQLGQEREGAVKVEVDSRDPERAAGRPLPPPAMPATSAPNGGSFYEHQQQQHMGEGAMIEGRRTQRAAAAKASDRGKRIAEMILECNEDGEHGIGAEGDGGGPGHRDGGASSNGSDNSMINREGGGGGEGENDEFVDDDFDGGGNSALYRRKPIKTRWSAMEDSRLKDAVDSFGSGNWKRVSGLSLISVLINQ